MNVTKAESHADVAVHVQLTDGPEVRVNYSRDKVIVVDRLVVTYRPGPGQNRGWWVATDVVAAGHVLLAPGHDGARRTGKARSKTTWTSWKSDDVQTKYQLPEQMDYLISELRPSGQVTFPADR